MPQAAAGSELNELFMTEIFYEFGFDAAHQFFDKPVGHKYRNLHGHSFRAEVTLRGTPDPVTGFVVDFADIEDACAILREQLDHRLLNEIDGLSNPSLENLARFIWEALEPRFAGLARVTVRRDSCNQGCTYTGSL